MHAVCVVEARSPYKHSSRKPEEKWLSVRPRYKLEDNIKICLKEV